MDSRPATLRLGLGLAAAVLALDLLTKWWILNVVMDPPRIIPVTPFFNLVLVYNPGTSFGLFASDSPKLPWILAALALAIVVGLGVWLWRARDRWVAAALGLVIGGAVGNLVDRVRYGAVVDFLDIHVAGYHWPAFNVADAGITVGVAILLWDGLIRRGA